ncbi:hypothetical protein ES703_62300 [subsurface metagenome]
MESYIKSASKEISVSLVSFDITISSWNEKLELEISKYTYPSEEVSNDSKITATSFLIVDTYIVRSVGAT